MMISHEERSVKQIQFLIYGISCIRLEAFAYGENSTDSRAGCRNNWHVHHADKGGGQILICVVGRGYYQEWGKEAVEMKPGENGSNEWLEGVDDSQYGILK